jgi:hypothetical protein
LASPASALPACAAAARLEKSPNELTAVSVAASIVTIALAAAALEPCAAATVDVRTDIAFPLPPQSTATYVAKIESRAPSDCGQQVYAVVADALPPGFSRTTTPGLFALRPGESKDVLISATAATTAEPGTHTLPFTVRVTSAGGGEHTRPLEFAVAPEADCFVQPDRELLIRDLSVVNDPVRTRSEWSFGELMRRASPAPRFAARFVERFFETWLSDQQLNGFTAGARPFVQQAVLTPWPRTPAGELDLSRAPLRLLAIVGRLDLRDLSRQSAGEGRFVFGVLTPEGLPTQFTVILEYRLPARSRRDVLVWAEDWHALAVELFPSERYNERLAALTRRFTRRGALPLGVNGSALRSVRTNELSLGVSWELRQFRLQGPEGWLAPTAMEGTPDPSWIDTALLGQFLEQNTSALEDGSFRVPRRYARRPLLGASAPNPFPLWTAPGQFSSLARRQFALGTCSGCHGDPETGTAFLHVLPRREAEASVISAFLSGVALRDPVTREVRVFNELGRRKRDLEALVCDCSDAHCPEIAASAGYRDHSHSTEP